MHKCDTCEFRLTVNLLLSNKVGHFVGPKSWYLSSGNSRTCPTIRMANLANDLQPNSIQIFQIVYVPLCKIYYSSYPRPRFFLVNTFQIIPPYRKPIKIRWLLRYSMKGVGLVKTNLKISSDPSSINFLSDMYNAYILKDGPIKIMAQYVFFS